MLQFSPYKAGTVRQQVVQQNPGTPQYRQQNIQQVKTYGNVNPQPIYIQSPIHITDQQEQKKHQTDDNLSDIISNLEARIQLLVQENKRVGDQMKDKIREGDLQRKENQELILELHALRGQDFEIDIIKEVSELRLRESEKWRFKCNSLENQIKELNSTNMDSMNKFALLQQEISSQKSRFSDLDQERLKQVEQTRQNSDEQKFHEIEDMRKIFDKEVEELQQNLIVVTTEYEKMSKNLKRLLEENQSLRNMKTFREPLKDDDQIKSRNSNDTSVINERNKYLMQENQKLFFQNENLNKEILILIQRVQEKDFQR